MKRIIIYGLALLATGCGGGGSSAPVIGSKGGWTSYAVQTAAELPTCAGEIVGRLYYVESLSAFRVCKQSGWETVNLGSVVESNRLLAPPGTDFCTDAAQSCFFNGGQIIKYRDGSVHIMGVWTQVYVSQTADSDTDTDVSNLGVLFPPETSVGYQRLAPLVMRGGVIRGVYLVYTSSPESIFLVWDTDGDAIPETTDELLHTVTIANW